MKKITVALAGAAACISLPAVAQDSAGAEPFIGVSAGYHDLGVDGDVEPALAGFDINDGSPIVGVFAGVDFPMGSDLFAGIEGNFHIGTDVIDSEYGASARFGFRANGGAKYYVRGGYQVVDLDPYKVVEPRAPDGTFDGFDDSDSDYLVGAGVEFPIGRSALRINLDTISFDTLRATAGFAFRF